MTDQKGSTKGFEYDENGQFKLVPLILPELMKKPSSMTKSEQLKNSARKYIPIERLILTPADFDESPRSLAKRRRTEKPVCKELFKIPTKKTKPGSRLSSFNNYRNANVKSISTIKNGKRSSLGRKTVAPKITITDFSPLLDFDEAETLMKKGSLIKKKPVKTVLFPIDTITEESDGSIFSKASPVKVEETRRSRRDSMISEMEFIEIERIFAAQPQLDKIHETQQIQSPLSDICTLLENTKVNQSQKSKTKSNIAEEIKAIISADRAQLDMLKREFQIYQKRHDASLAKIEELIKQIDCDEDKENTRRRSGRIASQISITEKTKVMLSPSILRNADLRKETLTKNLSKNLHCEPQSPRMKKAVDLYNNFRNDCSVLCTPKLDRRTIDLPQASVTRSLSRRVQRQCLLLQDTPKQTS